MKYIIDIPNADISRWIGETPLGKKLYVPISVEDGKEYGVGTGIYAEEYTEPDRKTIEDEVWEFAKKIGSFNGLAKHELDECFGHTTIQGVMTTYDTYQEAKEKYEAWKKEKEKFRVGDEVKFLSLAKVGVVVNENDTPNVVGDKAFNVVWEDGATGYHYKKDLFRTGRHFKEVEELMKKMRDAE